MILVVLLLLPADSLKALDLDRPIREEKRREADTEFRSEAWDAARSLPLTQNNLGLLQGPDPWALRLTDTCSRIIR